MGSPRPTATPSSGHKAPGIDATYTHTYAIDLKRKALELDRVYAEESHPVAGTGAA